MTQDKKADKKERKLKHCKQLWMMVKYKCTLLQQTPVWITAENTL